MMGNREAIEIVLELARKSVIRDNDDEVVDVVEQWKQLRAIETVETLKHLFHREVKA